jgi:hypothetical protein
MKRSHHDVSKDNMGNETERDLLPNVSEASLNDPSLPRNLRPRTDLNTTEQRVNENQMFASISHLTRDDLTSGRASTHPRRSNPADISMASAAALFHENVGLDAIRNEAALQTPPIASFVTNYQEQQQQHELQRYIAQQLRHLQQLELTQHQHREQGIGTISNRPELEQAIRDALNQQSRTVPYSSRLALMQQQHQDHLLLQYLARNSTAQSRLALTSSLNTTQLPFGGPHGGNFLPNSSHPSVVSTHHRNNLGNNNNDNNMSAMASRTFLQNPQLLENLLRRSWLPSTQSIQEPNAASILNYNEYGSIQERSSSVSNNTLERKIEKLQEVKTESSSSDSNHQNTSTNRARLNSLNDHDSRLVRTVIQLDHTLSLENTEALETTSHNFNDRVENFLSDVPRPASNLEVLGEATTGSESSRSYFGYNPGKLIPLYLQTDPTKLSEFQCLLRQQICLFEAGIYDIQSSAQGRNKPISMGQVGIVCRHCASVPPGLRPGGSMYFPSKLVGLYQSSQNMATNHFVKNCRNIPDEIRIRLNTCKDKKAVIVGGGGKQYWAIGARTMGVIESEDGLLFQQDKKNEANNII